MSFDEEPDAPLHGECAAEIHRLEKEVADAYRQATDNVLTFARNYDASEARAQKLEEHIESIASELCRYGDADYWTNARTADLAARLRRKP
jgi:hypothetical protein